MSTTAYLDRFLEPVTEAFTPAFARKLVNLRAEDHPDLQAHVEELRRKANDGTLTTEEAADYREFIEAVDVISVLQAKARRYLSQNAT